MNTLHGRIEREVEVTVRIVESRKTYKIKGTPETRLQTVANNLAVLLDLDPLCTQWAFFPNSAAVYEYPVSYTLHQIKPNAYHLSLLAKIMTTTMVKDYFLEKDIQTRVFKSSWTGKSKIALQDKATQKDETQMRSTWSSNQTTLVSKQPYTTADPWGLTRIGKLSQGASAPKESPRLNTRQPIYTLDGIPRPPKRTFAKLNFVPQTTVDIWAKLESFKEQHIMRGMNAVGYCSNPQCVNYHRWICISLGYGRFTSEKIQEVIRCEICPSKAMQKLPHTIVENSVTNSHLPNPPALEGWRGRQIKSASYHKFFTYGTIFDGDKSRSIQICVKPLDRAEMTRDTLTYHNPNIAFSNKLY